MNKKGVFALIVCLLTIAASGLLAKYKLLDPLVSAGISLTVATVIGGLFKQFKFAWPDQDVIAHIKASKSRKTANDPDATLDPTKP